MEIGNLLPTHPSFKIDLSWKINNYNWISFRLFLEQSENIEHGKILRLVWRLHSEDGFFYFKGAVAKDFLV